MKKLLVLLGLLLSVFPSASAAVAPKPMVQLAQVDSAATNVIASANQVAVIGNRDKNGFIQFLNGPTVELTSGIESFVSAATTDIAGNFYVVGASANPIVGTLPPISGVSGDPSESSRRAHLDHFPSAGRPDRNEPRSCSAAGWAGDRTRLG